MSSQPGKAPKRETDRRQRRYPRFRTEFPVSVTLLSGEGRLRHDAHCRDLSEAGIGVLVAAELTPGEVVSLGFTLPGMQQAWDIGAVLRHRRGYHYGFEFFALTDQQGKALGGYLTKLERAD